MNKLATASALLCLAAVSFAGFGQSSALPEPKIAIDNPNPSVADLFSCLHGKTTIVSAHRGGPVPGYPESAIETFAHTLSQQPVLFETDVRTSSDGVLMVMHDETLDRTTTGHGLVRQTTWAQMSQLYLKDNDGKVTAFRIPSLEAILNWTRGRGIVALDMKEGADAKAVAAAVRAAKAEPYAAAVVYSPAQAKAFLDADPNITIVYDFEKMSDFDATRQAGIADNRILAWLGLDPMPSHIRAKAKTVQWKSPNALQRRVWKTARERGMPIIFGTLFFADYAMNKTGNYTRFNDLARRGVDILPTDYTSIAFRQIDPMASAQAALATCHALP